MDKKYFSVKLIASRPTFMFDMNDDERSIMMAHAEYWKNLMAHGHVLVFGPVIDPAGPYGLGIIVAESEAAVKVFLADDPAKEISTYLIHPMLAIVPGN